MIKHSPIYRFLHLMIHLHYCNLCSIIAPLIFIFSLNDWKSLHDMIDFRRIQTIQMKEQCIQLGAEDESARLVPSKWRSIIP